MPRLLLALLLALPCLPACTRKTSDRDLQWVTPYQAIERINQTPDLLGKAPRSVWVDPRTPVHFAQGHVPGAVSIPFPSMTSEAETRLAGYDTFFVYGTNWEDTISKAASKRLMELGFDNVYTLEGGLAAWTKDGNPVETGVPAPAAP